MPRSTDFPRARAHAFTQRTAGPQAERHEDRSEAPRHRVPVGSSYDEAADLGKLGAFGAGLVIGIAVGAGATLLLAPRSGAETRELLGARARLAGDRMADRWDDLRDELHRAARRSRRKVRRSLTRGRWAMEDVRDR